MPWLLRGGSPSIFDVAAGADEVVARMGVDGGDLVALHHAHGRQADRAMIDADDAAGPRLEEDQALDHRLSIFGDAFRIHGDDANAMIGPVDRNAAAGVDIGDRLLEAPIHADAAGH